MPRRLLTWASSHIGNRGVVACLLGLIWVCIALNTALSDPIRLEPDRYIQPFVVAAWAGPGIYAIVFALRNRFGRNDHNVWALLMLAPAERLVTQVVALVIDALHATVGLGDNYATGRATLSLCIWLAVVAMIDRCAAGLDRVPPPKRRRDR